MVCALERRESLDAPGHGRTALPRRGLCLRIPLASTFARTKNIKACLLDQRLVAGLGNIYTDEILFDAEISPLRMSNSLDEDEIQTLFTSIQRILREESCFLAASPDFFLAQDIQLLRGKGQAVYGRKGKPCPRCGATLDPAHVAGEVTTDCPVCQK